MDFIDHRLLEYAEKHSDPEPDLLKELHRETYLKANSPRMLSGHLQGRFLSLLSRLVQPSSILEIGTYTGYSALCLAEGLAPGGILTTIDPNEETNAIAKRYFQRSGWEDRIRLLEGQAEALIPTLIETWDLVFIDADKRNYSLYFDLVGDKIKSGGLVIADNVLWSGKVIGTDKDPDTLAVRAFNEKAAADRRFSSVMLPLRDGLTVLRRR